MNATRATNRLISLSIFLFGLGISLWYGRQGINPLDSSIIFDGAWRLMQGQTYFSDFSTPNGFVPIIFQTLFFKLLGVNWFAYCLHAAVFNGLFALLANGILRLAGGPRWLSAGYALMSAVVFYPPMGVPYMDQHAFFFVLLGVWIAMLASQKRGRPQFWLISSLPAVAMLAVLSKQSPGIFAVPLSALVLLCWMPKRQWPSTIAALLLGLAPAFATFCVVVGLPWQIWGPFWDAFWKMPQSIADQRLAEWTYGPFKTLRAMAWFPFQTLSSFHFIHRHLLFAPFLLLLVEWAIRKWRQRPRAAWPPLRLLVMGIGMSVTCSFFMHFTLNQPQNGLPLVLVSIGLGHIFWRKWWQGFEFDFSGRFRHVPMLMKGLSVLMLLYGGWATLQFHQKTNVPRLVLDFTPDFPFQSDIPKANHWGFLEYQAPFHYGSLKPWELTAWMDAHKGTFLLFGDLSILYGMTGRPSVSPVLWFHEGLTYAPQGSAAFARLDRQLLEMTQKAKIRFVVFEHPEHLSWMHAQLEQFRITHRALAVRQTASYEVGGFTVWELRK